jgi:hypothetical protein
MPRGDRPLVLKKTRNIGSHLRATPAHIASAIRAPTYRSLRLDSMAVTTAAAAEAGRYAWTVAVSLAATAVSTAPWVAACTPTLFARRILARFTALLALLLEVGEHGMIIPPPPELLVGELQGHCASKVISVLIAGCPVLASAFCSVYLLLHAEARASSDFRFSCARKL